MTQGGRLRHVSAADRDQHELMRRRPRLRCNNSSFNGPPNAKIVAQRKSHPYGPPKIIIRRRCAGKKKKEKKKGRKGAINMS
ncbi:hypothetical protein ACVWW2_003266 [Bradyrhizobium sp. LM4.3]